MARARPLSARVISTLRAKAKTRNLEIFALPNSSEF